MRVRDLMRDLAELDPDAILITEIPSGLDSDIWDLSIEVVGVRRCIPPYVLIETERRE